MKNKTLMEERLKAVNDAINALNRLSASEMSVMYDTDNLRDKVICNLGDDINFWKSYLKRYRDFVKNDVPVV